MIPREVSGECGFKKHYILPVVVGPDSVFSAICGVLLPVVELDAWMSGSVDGLSSVTRVVNGELIVAQGLDLFDEVDELI